MSKPKLGLMKIGDFRILLRLPRIYDGGLAHHAAR